MSEKRPWRNSFCTLRHGQGAGLTPAMKPTPMPSAKRNPVEGARRVLIGGGFERTDFLAEGGEHAVHEQDFVEYEDAIGETRMAIS